MPALTPSMSRTVARDGFTVAELLVAAALTAVLFSVAIPFFQAQARAVSQHAGRLDAQLGARYALTSIDRDLRSAGVGVVDIQPMLVEAGPRALTFNADLVSRDATIPGAVNTDPDAPESTVGVLERSAPINLPATGRQYPESTYVQRGLGATPDSRAETIAYWARPDSVSPRTDEFVLYRRVNAARPEVVLRGLVLKPGDAIFSYLKSNALGRQVDVQPDSLPLLHVAVHGGKDDRGRSALADSVRTVRVRLTARSVDRRTRRTTLSTVQSSVRLVNAGLLRRTTCGEVPLKSVALVASRTTVDGVPSVTLVWQRSGDDGQGERDVERYLVFRRFATDPPDFDEPLLSIVSDGSIGYTYVDRQVELGRQYVYGVAAQDCSPQNSAVVSTLAVQP